MAASRQRRFGCPGHELPRSASCRAVGGPVSRQLSESSAQNLLEEACAADGLSADDATLMRIGSNAVYHLAAPVVVRISRQGADLDEARRAVAVARWLESVHYPAVRAIDVDQPIGINGHVVTFWKSASKDGQDYATVAQVAEVLARLHKLTTPADLHLPTLEPFEHAAARILTNEWLTDRDRDFLTSSLPGCKTSMPDLSSSFGQGLSMVMRASEMCCATVTAIRS